MRVEEEQCSNRDGGSGESIPSYGDIRYIHREISEAEDEEEEVYDLNIWFSKD